MKGAVIVCLVCVAVVSGLPAKKDEVEIVPRKGSSYGDQPIVDTGVLFPEDSISPFGGSFDYIQGLFTRLRQQMDELIRSFPFRGTNDTDISSFPDFPLGGPHLPPFDLGKGNTTSVTKIIDGHKVVINETEYRKEDDFGGALFKVRVIDVQPDSGESTTTGSSQESSEVTKDREPIESNSFENEIPKSGEAAPNDNIETFDEPDHSSTSRSTAKPIESVDNSLNPPKRNFKPIDLSRDILVNEMFPNKSGYFNPDAESVPASPEMRPIDLDRDTYVNEIAANLGRPVNPDSEVVVGVDGRPVQGPFYRFQNADDNIETFDETDNAVNESWNEERPIESIDDNSLNPSTSDLKPIDLSGDTLVNDLLRKKFQYLNPDAEYIPISPDSEESKYKNLETFESSPTYEKLESFDYESPKDVSRDTDVNKIAETSGHPTNPESEFVSVDGESLQGPYYEYKHVR